ncbi:MAG: hypothetical protein HQL12_09075 [Candidatus Omnitrophica bacterium]|nr:hypothetical protein [Candidatus Omnitrophota bacterium]
MKKFIAIFVLSFNLSFLFLSLISYAGQITMSSYNTSASGKYTKVHLINTSSGPNTVNCFCAQNSKYANGCQNGSVVNPCPTCDIGEPAGVTYPNAGVIFADPTTGYMEVCKNDGSFASYPGSCYNRFGPTPCTSTYNPNLCPNNYKCVAPSLTDPTSQIVNFGSGTGTGTGSQTLYSYSCCFTGQGTSTTAAVTKSGCFSTYSSGTCAPSTSPATPAQPALCSSVDVNAYDINCETINQTDAHSLTVYKRTCCYNNPSGKTSAYYSTCTCSCVSTGCGSVDPSTIPCGQSYTDNCGNPCPNTGTYCSSGQTCSASGTCVCGGSSCNLWETCLNNSNCCRPGQKFYGTCCTPTTYSNTDDCTITGIAGSDNCGGKLSSCPLGQICNTGPPNHNRCVDPCTLNSWPTGHNCTPTANPNINMACYQGQCCITGTCVSSWTYSGNTCTFYQQEVYPICNGTIQSDTAHRNYLESPLCAVPPSSYNSSSGGGCAALNGDPDTNGCEYNQEKYICSSGQTCSGQAQCS